MNITQEDNPRESVKPPLKSEDEYHIYLSYFDQEDGYVADEEFAEKEVRQPLREKGYKIWNQTSAGKTEIERLENGLKSSQKTIVILSRKYFENQYTAMEQIMAMYDMAKHKEKKLTIIPILFNPKGCQNPLHEWEIPPRLAMLNYIHADKEHFLERLCLAINANVALEDALPAGNVAYGLAWSYFYGYLNLILKDLPDRIKKCQEIWNPDPSQRRVALRMFLVIPKSCYCPPSFSDADPRISDSVKLETYKASRAGNPERPYPAFSKKITLESGKEYFFVGEFVTPILAMYEMDVERISGLTQTEKYEQVRVFYNTLKDILNHPNARHCHGKTEILFYDDEKEGEKYPLAETLAEMIKLAIEKDIEFEQSGTAL